MLCAVQGSDDLGVPPDCEHCLISRPPIGTVRAEWRWRSGDLVNRIEPDGRGGAVSETLAEPCREVSLPGDAPDLSRVSGAVAGVVWPTWTTLVCRIANDAWYAW